MPRDTTGAYVLPSAQFTPGTSIQAAPVNSNLVDIAQAITNSLAVDGSNAMVGTLKLSDGNRFNPSLTFINDAGIGFYLAGPNQMNWAVGGQIAAEFRANGEVAWFGSVRFNQELNITGTLNAGSVAAASTWTMQGRPVTSLNAASAMVFFSATAPTRWTQLNVNDFTLRTVSTAGGGFGGVLGLTTVFGITGVGSASPGNAIHSHSMPNAYVQNSFFDGLRGVTAADTGANLAQSTSEGGSTAHGHSLDLRCKYLDFILCNKNA